MSIDHLGGRVPKDCRLQCCDGCLLISTTLIYSAAKEECFRVGRFDNQDLSDFCQGLVIPSLLVQIANLVKRFLSVVRVGGLDYLASIEIGYINLIEHIARP